MTDNESRAVRLVPSGPVMVQGPVRIEMPDGSVVESDRFMVAICTCRRSRHIPCATLAIGADGAGIRQGKARRNDERSCVQHSMTWAARRSSTTSRALIPNTTSRSSCGSPATRSPTTSVRTTCS
jgi:hypothetical protein